MDRAEAILVFEGVLQDSFNPDVRDACYMAITALREQEQSRWISVKEKLPENHKEVLIYCGSYHEIGWYESDNKSWRSDFLGCCTDDVTHWMPLPEPPEGGADHE